MVSMLLFVFHHLFFNKPRARYLACLLGKTTKAAVPDIFMAFYYKKTLGLNIFQLKNN